MSINTLTVGAMSQGSNFTTPYKYVQEAIWLPTYLVVALLVFGTVQGSATATVVMVVTLTACRMFLELLYRWAFGDERLTFRIGLLSLVSQLVVWGAVLGWYFQRSQNMTS